MIFLGSIGGLWLAESMFVSRSSESTHDTSILFPMPRNLTDLIDNADVIVIGTVGKIVDEGAFEGYDQDGNFIRSTDFDPDNLSIDDTALPFVDYVIQVEKVIKDDGTIKSNRPVILRMPGNRTGKIPTDSEYPMSAPGDHHLFFLSRNPDRKSYGLYYGARSRLTINGPVVTYSNGAHTPIIFDDLYGRAIEPNSFIQKVEELVKEKSNQK
jgi:hypothetical protein